MIVVTSPASAAGEQSAVARRAMIDSQLRVSGVSDPAVLSAMQRLPREDFLPAERRAAAYSDRAQPLAPGRALASPLAHGQLVQEARPSRTDKVLLIGGGTGYLAALLGPMVGSLTVVESDPDLAEAAPQQAGTWTIGPLAGGNAEAAPYSLIIIDGAIEQLPEAIAAQLADDGRLFTGLIDRGVGRLAIGKKAADSVSFLIIGDAEFPRLADFAAPARWSF